jgi:hypothetical protein
MKENNRLKKNLEGYPIYPANEDLFRNGAEEKEIDIEAMTNAKDVDPDDMVKPIDETDFTDLDVPGSELDNQQESIGSEDEENNYYSLGDDDPIRSGDDKE